MSWQPIDTAPKDGTRVFLLFDGHHPDVGHFVSEQTYEHGEMVRERNEWWGSRLLFNISNWERKAPTHWMPIPPAPKE